MKKQIIAAALFSSLMVGYVMPASAESVSTADNMDYNRNVRTYGTNDGVRPLNTYDNNRLRATAVNDDNDFDWGWLGLLGLLGLAGMRGRHRERDHA